MNITLMQINAFLTVARFGSFTKAAHELHLSQPALSVQIQQFEEGLGLRLFDRNTRHVDLTSTGRDLAPLLRHLMQEFEAAVTSAQDISAKRQGIIRFACLPSLACTYLPEAIAQFRKLHPQVSFVLRDAVGKRVVSMVREDEVEFGITDGEPNWPDFESFELSRDEMHVVFPSSHPIARRKKVTLHEIAEYPLVFLDPETNSRIMLDNAFAAENRLVLPACEVTYISTAIGMVRAGLGLAILSSLSIKATNLRSIPEIRSRRIDDPGLVRSINLVKKAGRALTPSAQSFADLLINLSRGNRWGSSQSSAPRKSAYVGQQVRVALAR
jgi:DNA-binding transcriptional LysR family regulator